MKEKPSSHRRLGRRVWNLLSKLPSSIKGPIIRSLFEIDLKNEDGIIYKKAETTDEIDQALRLAYEGFLDRGLVEQKSAEQQIRITKYHALPTTTILIAKVGDEVIATMSIIVDSALGLPVETLWQIDDLRSQTKRVAEISTLAIKKGYRAKRGKILLPLCAYMYRYCVEVISVSTIIAVFHPEIRDYYHEVMFFRAIGDGKVKYYNFVKGAAAVAGFLNLETAPEKFRRSYSHKKPAQNLFSYFTGELPHNFIWPDRHGVVHELKFNSNTLSHYFSNCSDVFAQLSFRERLIIANFYPDQQSKAILLNTIQGNAKDYQRAHPRFTVGFSARIESAGSNNEYSIREATLLELSESGARIHTKNLPVEIKCGDQIRLRVRNKNSPDEEVTVLAVVQWVNVSGSQMGVRVVGDIVDHRWTKLVREVRDYATRTIADTDAINVRASVA